MFCFQSFCPATVKMSPLHPEFPHTAAETTERTVHNPQPFVHHTKCARKIVSKCCQFWLVPQKCKNQMTWYHFFSVNHLLVIVWLSFNYLMNKLFVHWYTVYKILLFWPMYNMINVVIMRVPDTYTCSTSALKVNESRVQFICISSNRSIEHV